MTTRERMRWAYRRGMLVSALYQGTWPPHVPVPADLADDPAVMRALRARRRDFQWAAGGQSKRYFRMSEG